MSRTACPRLGVALVFLMSICSISAAAPSGALVQRLASSVHYEPNHGQTDGSVSFVGRGGGFLTFLRGNDVWFSLPPASRSDARPFASVTSKRELGAVLRMAFDGATWGGRSKVTELQAGVSNYLRGRSHDTWRTSVPHFGAVTFHDVYPGIDVVFHGSTHPEFDFVVKPGGNPSTITLRFSGNTSLRINASGELEVLTASGTLLLRRPSVFQWIDGRRVEVEATYVVNDDRVSFRIAKHDESYALTFDPVLEYFAYFGSPAGSDTVVGNAVTDAGELLITGTSLSLDFPLKNALDPLGDEIAYDAFITKFSAAFPDLVFSTYLGGVVGEEVGGSIGVDSAGAIYIGGRTGSTGQGGDFPMVGGFSACREGPATVFSVGFIAKLPATGDALLHSNCLPGTAGHALIRVIAADVVAFVGTTTVRRGDVVVGRYRTDLGAIEMRVDFGGTADEFAGSLAVGPGGRITVMGETQSLDLPVVNAFQAENHRGRTIHPSDLFIGSVAADGHVEWLTYLGGNDTENNSGLVMAADGSTWLLAFSFDPLSFPTRAPFFTGSTFASCVLAKLSPTGHLLFSTVLPDLSYCQFQGGIALDAKEDLFLGYSTSAAIQPTLAGFPKNPGHDSVIVKVRKDLAGIEWAAHVGTVAGTEYAWNLAIDPAGSLYLAGFDAAGPSTQFGDPTTPIFVAKIRLRQTVLVDATMPATFSLSGAACHGAGTTTPSLVGIDAVDACVVSFPTRMLGPGTRQQFIRWTDGSGEMPRSLSNVSDGTKLTALISTQHELTTEVRPPGAGTIAGAGWFDQNDIVAVQATAASGYAFVRFSNGASGSQSRQSLIMNTPKHVVAEFVSTVPPSLTATIVDRTGPADARLWTVRLANNGGGIAAGAALSSLALEQTAGAACTPVVMTLLPVVAGVIAPGASANASASLDFSGCAATARFRATIGFAANDGRYASQTVLNNLFR